MLHINNLHLKDRKRLSRLFYRQGGIVAKRTVSSEATSHRVIGEHYKHFMLCVPALEQEVHPQDLAIALLEAVICPYIGRKGDAK